MIEKMWPVKEACKRLGISERLIYKYFLQGRIVRSKIGKRTLVRDSELQKLIQDRGPYRDFAVELKKTSLVPTDIPESRSTSPFSRVVIGQLPAGNIPVPPDDYDPLIPSKEPDEEDGPSFSHMFASVCPNCGWHKFERSSVHVETLTPKRLAVLAAIAAHIQQYKCPPKPK